MISVNFMWILCETLWNCFQSKIIDTSGFCRSLSLKRLVNFIWILSGACMDSNHRTIYFIFHERLLMHRQTLEDFDLLQRFGGASKFDTCKH